MNVLVTGAAGFIGNHVARRLLARGDRVVALDNLDPYYSVALKRRRLELIAHPRCEVLVGDVGDPAAVERAFAGPLDAVVHLAAKVGVRHSLSDPLGYVATNVGGFARVLEAARHKGVGHFVYASSSSVYGADRALPFREAQTTDHPISIYAATKKADELLAHSYSHLFALPTTGLRFFTVYGPWGRPDMAMFLFTKKILAGEPVALFGDGARRDFTFVDDAADAVLAILDRPAAPDPTWDARAPRIGSSDAPFRVVNVGTRTSVEVSHLVALLEAALGRKAIVERQPRPGGDLAETQADVDALEAVIGPRAVTPLAEGVARFVAWYRGEYAALGLE